MSRKEIFIKLKLKLLITLFIVGLGLLYGRADNVYASTKNELLEVLSNKTSEVVCKSFYCDMNQDGENELLAITSENGKDEEYNCAFEGHIWYVDKKKCNMVYSAKYGIYLESVKLWSVKNAKILHIEDGTRGTSSVQKAWSFIKGKIQVLKIGEGGISRASKDQFYIYDDQYDAMYDGAAYVGHTWNKYYAKWNGKKLIEYGGIKISKKTLLKVKGANKIIKEIENIGKITSIYYRANNIININYLIEEGEMISYYNVALSLKNKKVKYADSYSNLQEASARGVIKKAITKSASYPKKFPI